MEKTKDIKNAGRTKEAKEVICLSCKKKALVQLKPYGNGHIAVCPICNELAYSGE